MNAAEPVSATPRVEEGTAPKLRLRLGAILRDVTRGGLAAIIAGTLVLGLGARLVMRIAAVLSPDATGSLTEADAAVGTISANGTLALILFGGLLSGAAAGVVWVVVSPWLPGRGQPRRALAAVVALGLAGSFLARSSNRDFAILEADGLVVALLLGLIAAMGWVTAWLDDVLDRRLPTVSADRSGALLAFGGVAALGCLFIPVATSIYLVNDTNSPYPMAGIGQAIAVVAVVTVVAWLVAIAGPGIAAKVRPSALRVVGGIAVAAATLIGYAHLVPEVGRILAAG
ncbi:MAG: hypothetical protein ABIV26_07270 [Candidatus Limnocylindrales bacterium]